ncbi:hypothetical protein K450DRAFT_270226 [Umbelopsis ramanniana AG]|uniref:MMS19 nucleotide excision repair protein n=1 Tax=Umbelopsis ramanniana AG TaxID=1314678 RepID=A0AAD5EDE9_UMBRA|nr:uncharacterized protein K450DRAFT_270226 [Umbelopsis ramanniana AG]KAI8581362.1 hypothetical protein K450DRAFT_270226 [Umbelopsis ramanniana AG]
MSTIASNARDFLTLQYNDDYAQAIIEHILTDWNDETISSIVDELNKVDSSDSTIGRKVVYLVNEMISRYEELNIPNTRTEGKYPFLPVFGEMLQRPDTQKFDFEALVSQSDELIPQFIQAMDGEKDPRNLLIAFKIFKLMTRVLDISKYIEDLFELLWCYFPITFKPPPGDPYAITSEELKQHLRECIAATPYFAKFAMPSLQEKLENPSDVVKKEAIATITVCAPVYGAHALLPGITEILSVLSTQIFYAKDNAMQSLALSGIHVITATLATGISIAAISDPIQRSLDPLIDECIMAMKQPEHKNARSAIALLRSAASASDPACTSIVERAVPSLLSSYRNAYNDSERIAVLELIIEIMEASRTLYGSMDGQKVDRDFMTPLLSFKEPLLDLYSNAAESTTDLLQYKGCHGLYVMVASRHFLNEGQTSGVVKILTKISCDSHLSLLRENALASLRKIGLFCPSSVINIAIPLLLSRLQFKDQKQDILGLLSQLGGVPAIYDVIIPTLSEEFMQACVQDQKYADFVMKKIVQATEAGLQNKKELGEEHQWAEMIRKILLSTVHCCQNEAPLSANTLDLLAYWVANVVRKLSSSTQVILAQLAFDIYIGNLSAQEGSVTSQQHVNVLASNTSDDVSSLSVVFVAIVCNCRKEVMSQHITSMKIPLSWIRAGIESTHAVRLTSCAQLAAVYANQWTKDASTLNQFLNEALITYIQPALNDVASRDQRKNAVVVLAWLTKAMVITGKPALSFDHIINALQNEDIGHEAAIAFKVIAGESDILLNKQSFAKYSILYKQRLYNTVIHGLIKGINEQSSDIIQQNHLIALCHILGNVPKQVYIANLTTLFPFLVQSLRIPQTFVKLTAIHLVVLTLDQLPLVVKQHIQSIIPSLLELCRTYPGNTIAVRVDALDCLGRLTDGLQAPVLMPFTSTVIKSLSYVVDDRKRVSNVGAINTVMYC